MEPMNQGVFSAFKAYYLKWTVRWVIDATTGEHAFSVAEFWKKYDIQHALENVQASQQDVMVRNRCRMAGTFTTLYK